VFSADLLYDGRMGFATSVKHESKPGYWVVSVKVNLSRAETNELFLSGDSMLSWPSEGLVPTSTHDSKPERSGMFVSEVAAQPEGLAIRYGDQAQAERTAALIRTQLAQIGINEEA
jgi:hypothetical protein